MMTLESQAILSTPFCKTHLTLISRMQEYSNESTLQTFIYHSIIGFSFDDYHFSLNITLIFIG
jgi:hypothetical protein